MKKLLDIFFWRDPYTGKRRPRLLFWPVATSMIAVVLVWGLAGYLTLNPPAALPPTNTPLPPTNTPLPTATFTPSPVPTATPVPVTQVDKLLAEINGCEKDPANWTLTDQNAWTWKVLSEPKCALTGLSRAVAWYIMVRSMGYTVDEAAQALGYPEGQYPWAISKSGWTYFATATKKGYAPLEWGFRVKMREWKVKDGEIDGVVLTPRGCFYANHVEHGDVVWWDKYGFPFTIQCYFYEDFTADHSIYQREDGADFCTDTETKQFRYPLLFAYSPDSGWVFLGRIYDPKFWHEPADDYDAIRQRWDVPPWDISWVEETWEVTPQPLPNGWQSNVDTEHCKDIWNYANGYSKKWAEEHATYNVEPPKK